MPAKLPPGEARRRKTARHKAWRHKNRARLRALRQTRDVADPANERARVREYFRRRRVDAAGRPPPSACECCGRRGRLVFDHDHAALADLLHDVAHQDEVLAVFVGLVADL